MSTPTLPTAPKGPAIVIRDGKAFYFKDGIQVTHDVRTFDIKSDFHGKQGEVFSSDLIKITGTPDGQIADLDKYFPYSTADIGKSIFGGSATALVIHTKDGQTITYHRSAVTKMPTLTLRPLATVFGDMEWTCIGKPNVQRTDAAFFKTLASAAFADTSYSRLNIKTGLYHAAWGGSPFASMGAIDGFTFEVSMNVEETLVDDVGVEDISLTEIFAMVKFKPSNLTQAQVDTLVHHSGSGAILPGQSMSVGNNDLIITGDALVATLFNAGPKGSIFQYGVAKLRNGEIGFVPDMTWTDGVANPLWSFEIPE